ncbi:MAG: copper chaperone PCu(A)C [Actinobacteria bacterium]|nr:copper chaperone PCu(A)C [Actinomycetota bacterium]
MGRTTWALASTGLAAALLLGGCSSSSDSASDSPSASATETSQTLSVMDAWAKASDSGMSAVFGTVTNETDADVQIVSASTSASGMTELHETVDVDGQSQMQQVSEFTVPAGGSLTLEPGGDHIMIMGLTTPVKAGEEVTVTLNMSDGQSQEFTAQAKDTGAGEEPYHSGSASPSSSQSN